MRFSLGALLALATACLTPALTATAQSVAASPSTYIGPRFAGGPDSLRALVYRSVQQAGAAPKGRILLKFELSNEGKPRKSELVRPPKPLNPALVNAAAKAGDYLQAQPLAWQPGTPDPDFPPSTDAPKVLLALDFTATAPATRPYSYADQNPIFAGMADQLRARKMKYYDELLANPAKVAKYTSSLSGLAAFVQMQTRYPVEALRNQEQGTVYAYFEVAESGAIEQAEILGTAGRALDAEVLRIIQQLPTATTPAMLQGRPVRVYYVLPITWKII